MNFTFINAVVTRTTAIVAILALVVAVFGPMSAKAQVVTDGPLPVCTVIVNSNDDGDVKTQGGVKTYVHPNWTDEIIGAQWLWSDALVTNTIENQTRNFTHDFIWGGDTISNIDFQFAADNGYVVELNGTEIGSVGTAINNHESVTQLIVNPDDVIVGENTLSFEITNLATPDDTNPENNPAGFAFKMIIDGTGTPCDEFRPVEVPESVISGYKFNDENADGVWDKDSEPGIEGWEIVLSQEGQDDKYFTTNDDGAYSFTVANGSYQVSETNQKGWEQTATIGSGADGDICYITVEDYSDEIGQGSDGGFAGGFGSREFTCDFGNHEIEERGGGGSSSSGTRVGDRRGGTPTGEVRGASTSTPTGVVLGEATTTMPVGAPNTGAGGTAPISAHLPTLVAILSTTTRKSK